MSPKAVETAPPPPPRGPAVDPLQCIARGRGLREALVNQPARFTVHLYDSDGRRVPKADPAIAINVLAPERANAAVPLLNYPNRYDLHTRNVTDAHTHTMPQTHIESCEIDSDSEKSFLDVFVLSGCWFLGWL
jgi:hypothetical protein